MRVDNKVGGGREEGTGVKDLVPFRVGKQPLGDRPENTKVPNGH